MKTDLSTTPWRCVIYFCFFFCRQNIHLTERPKIKTRKSRVTTCNGWCIPPTALKMMQIAFNSSSVLLHLCWFFKTGCHSLQFCLPQSVLLVENNSISVVCLFFKVEVLWQHLLLGRLDVCQCAEWIGWIQKSQAIFNILANFSVHVGINTFLPYKEEKIDERRTWTCFAQSTITGFLQVFVCWCFFLCPGFSLCMRVKTSCVMSPHWAVNHTGSILDSTSVF